MVLSKHQELIQNLQSGNLRYSRGEMSHYKNISLVENRQKVAGGQQPEVAVISCADSRVVPEFIFDKGLGDLFVIRIAGNGITKEIIASLEFSVMHLGVKLVLIMGHESCGAIKAHCSSLTNKTNPDKNKPATEDNFTYLFKSLKPVGNLGDREGNKTTSPTNEALNSFSKANSQWGINKILSLSTYLNQAKDNEEISISSCYYSLKTGKVEFFYNNEN